MAGVRWLASGETVLLEKPIADNLSEAAALAPLIQDDSSNPMLGHIVMFLDSEFQELRKVAAERGAISYLSAARG